MAKPETGRAVLLYPYQSSNGRAYESSVIIGLEKASGIWMLPGGLVKPRESALEAAAREVWEELGLKVDKSTARDLGIIEGRHRIHHLYLMNATGKLLVNPAELDGIGFYGAGYMLDERTLGSDVKELPRLFYHSPHFRKADSGIIIPAKYIEQWRQQRRRFGKR